VDDLHDILWEIIEDKKAEASSERRAIQKSGWVDGQIQNYINHMKNMMRIEVLMFWSILNIMQDFYAYSMGKEMQMPPQLNWEEYDADLKEMELIARDEETGEVSFPRLTHLYTQAEGLLAPQEGLNEDPGAKGGPAKGKGKPAKAAKKGGKQPAKGGAPEEEEEEAVSPLEEEMTKAIFLEKQNIRYKLYMIKQVTLSKIQSLISNSEVLYQKMEDWQDYNITVENEAVENLANIFRDHIEDHTPIQKELRIEVIDIIESYKFLNFSTPPVSPRTANLLADDPPGEGDLQPRPLLDPPALPHVPGARFAPEQRGNPGKQRLPGVHGQTPAKQSLGILLPADLLGAAEGAYPRAHPNP
jgi:hypothetical protein